MWGKGISLRVILFCCCCFVCLYKKKNTILISRSQIVLQRRSVPVFYWRHKDVNWCQWNEEDKAIIRTCLNLNMHLTKASPNHITLLWLSTSSRKCEIDWRSILPFRGGSAATWNEFRLFSWFSCERSGDFPRFTSNIIYFLPQSIHFLCSYSRIKLMADNRFFWLFNYCFLISNTSYILRFLSLCLFIIVSWLIIIIVTIIIILQVEIHDLPLRQLSSFAYWITWQHLEEKLDVLRDILTDI